MALFAIIAIICIAFLVMHKLESKDVAKRNAQGAGAGHTPAPYASDPTVAANHFAATGETGPGDTAPGASHWSSAGKNGAAVTAIADRRKNPAHPAHDEPLPDEGRIAALESCILSLETALMQLKEEVGAIREEALLTAQERSPAEKGETEDTAVARMAAHRVGIPVKTVAMVTEVPEHMPGDMFDEMQVERVPAAASTGDMRDIGSVSEAHTSPEFASDPASVAPAMHTPDEDPRDTSFAVANSGTVPLEGGQVTGSEEAASTAQKDADRDIESFADPASGWSREQQQSKEPETPQEPSFLERAWEGLGSLGVTRFLAASNIWVLAGMGIMLMGLVFLVRFAMQFGLFGPEMRLACAGVVGLLLLGTGWRHRETRRELGLILQGGGVGALYLTVVAAVKLYELLPSALAFGLLVGIVVFSTMLAILQNARIMAHVSNIAGFLAPILVSTNSGNYIALFSYYVLLNLGIMVVSRFRPWRSLHLTGFLFTVSVGGLWGVENYTPELFRTVEPFLLVFFGMFTYLALAGSKPSSFALHGKKDVFVDVPLTLGTPLVFMLYQAAVAREIPFVLAFTSLGLGLLYLTIAWRMWSLRQNATGDGDALSELTQKGRTLQAEVYLSFGIAFANLTLPLALADFGLYDWGTRLMGLVWCMEGASLLWIGRKNRLRLFRWAGIGSLFLGGFFTLSYMFGGAPDYSRKHLLEEGIRYSFMYVDLGASLLLHLLGASTFVAAALAVRRYALEKEDPEMQRTASNVLLAAGTGWLFSSFFFELSRSEYMWEGALFLSTLMGIAAVRLARRLDWKELMLVPLLGYVPLVVLVLPMAGELLRLLFGSGQGGLEPPAVPAKVLVLVFAMYEFLALRSQKQRDFCPWGAVRAAIGLNLVFPMLMLLTASLVTQWVVLSETWFRMLCLVWPALFVAGLTQWAPGMYTQVGVKGSPAATPIAEGEEQEGANEPANAAESLLAAQKRVTTWLLASILPVAFLLVWLLVDIVIPGDPDPLFFLPLLNPMDIGLLLSIALLYRWVRKVTRFLPAQPWVQGMGKPLVWASAAFLWANLVIVRACSMLSTMPFSLEGIISNGSCQALMAILWGGTGLSAMFQGHKRHRRSLWLAGVFLVLADVAKLFLVDLTRIETVWRIVAFMVVGLLLIVIGYYVPLPPAVATEEKSAEKDSE